MKNKNNIIENNEINNENNKKIKKLLLLSCSLILIPICLMFLLLPHLNFEDYIIFLISAFILSISIISILSGIALLIYITVKYPKNETSLVILIIIIHIVLIITSLSIIVNQCLNELDKCPG